MKQSSKTKNTGHEQPRVVSQVLHEVARPGWLWAAVVLLSCFVIGVYVREYNPRYGWTRLDAFGSSFAKNALPRVKRNVHYVMEGEGLDGQFYAQMAIDPSLRDPAFDRALDNPAYRGRRIGLSVLSFCLGLGKPRWIIQAYALSNLLCWFVLLGALLMLFRPWTGKQVLCLSAGLLSFGTLASMKNSFLDLPGAALVFVGIAVSSWGRYTAFSWAVLTRETNALAALGCLDLRRPFTAQVWKRNLGYLALATVPLVLWTIYVGHRFDGLHSAAGKGNFALPFQAIVMRMGSALWYFSVTGLGESAKAAGPFGWLYLDELVHEMLTMVAIFAQWAYLVWRREPQSIIWRTAICYALLGCVLGPAVWGWTGAAARVLLPMTICFYLLVAKERDRVFWPFFLLGSLSVPYSVHDFWVFS